MIAARLFEWMQDHSKSVKLAAIPLLCALMAGVYALVYFTGGIKYVYSHSMYLIIVLAGLIYGTRGGIIAGVAGGIVLGPFMPIDVVTGEPQELANWLYRAGFFVMIGALNGAARDSTQMYLDRIKWSLRHDVLSGLPNRFCFIEALKEIDTGARERCPDGLALISLENVIEVESAYGPAITDEIVNQLAERLRTLPDEKLTIYRTNTHQIGVLLHDCAEEATDLLNAMASLCRQPFSYQGIWIHGDIRIGYAELASLEDGPEHYLRQAEVALRTASEKSQDWILFTPELDSATTKNNLELMGELSEAIQNDQLALYYQPKVSMATGSIDAVEALMRWNHPVRGNIPPGSFIPRAEESTLIDALTEWAIDNALTQIGEWKRLGIELAVAVNISTRNLLQPHFVDKVLELLERHQIDGRLLELELTEGSLMTDIERTIVKLMELAKVNVIISIDDFGTGYSSLQYLHSLPASTIKIDQSFIRTLTENSSAAHIVEAAVNLSHGLGMKVVAEGVEDKAAYEFLSRVGCDVAQGYFISRPIPAPDLTRWLTASGGRFTPQPGPQSVLGHDTLLIKKSAAVPSVPQ